MLRILGKLRNYQVKLYPNNSVKPVAVPPRSVPYHFKVRVSDANDNMVKEGVIEKHPIKDPSLWVSCAIIVPKTDGFSRITLDAHNINKAITFTNQPMPKQEDMRAQLTGAIYFSKLDFKSAFWLLELHPDSRYLTVLHANDKLYQYARLIMGVKPAQGKLNAALKPIFAHIPNVYLIHDDLILAAKTFNERNLALEEVMKAIDKANLTLNPKKCSFGKTEISFWGMIFLSSGVRPDPKKALENHPPPKNRSESSARFKAIVTLFQKAYQHLENF